MPKTKRELLHQLADKLGGEQAERMRAALKKKSPFDDLLDRPMSDEEFASQLQKAEHDLPKVLAKMKSADWGKPGTWGLPN
jgi:flagellar motility protein MotE (MotC chaperone)